MKRLFDFQCECGEVFERLIDAHIHKVECYCGKQAKRLLSMPTVKLDGCSGDFPGAHDKWARIREDNARIKAKRSFHGE